MGQEMLRPIGDGFEVDPAALGGVAGQLGRSYDDFELVAEYFADRGAGEVSAETFGAIGGAWVAFNEAWTYELLTIKTAIAELIQKVSATADTYRDAEYRNEKMIRELQRNPPMMFP